MADRDYDETLAKQWKLFRQKREERRKENLENPVRVEEEPAQIGKSELEKELEKQTRRAKVWRKTGHKKPDSDYGHKRGKR